MSGDVDTQADLSVSPYALTSPAEIIGVLRELVRSRSLLQLRVPPGVTSVVTTLLQVDGDALVLDMPGDLLARRITQVPEFILETSLDQVRVHFRLQSAELSTHEGREALRSPLPAVLLRMQRRDVFRVRTPVAQPVLCLVNTGGQELALPLDDIGAGGVGLFDDGCTLDTTVGTVYRGCRLELPEIGSVPVDLRVAQAREVALPNGRVRQRLGFAFEGNPGRALQLIQRYVTQLEREAIARRRGLV